MTACSAILAFLLVLPALAGPLEIDGRTWNHRAWEDLDQGRTTQAKEEFEKALDRAPNTSVQAEANLGLTLLALAEGKPNLALGYARSAGINGPYAVAAADQLAGEASLSQGNRSAALTYLRQALDVDPANLEVLHGLLRLDEKLKDRRASWLASARLLSFDPEDEEALRIHRRGPGFSGDPISAAGIRRLSKPFLVPEGAPSSSAGPLIRLGLYGAPDGRPAQLTRLEIMPNSDFRAETLSGAALRDGSRGQVWSFEYRADNAAVEARDSFHNLLFTSTQSFRISVSTPRGSLLLQNAALKDPAGIDPGDRETRGSLLVIPSSVTFHIMADIPLESYLYGVVAMALSAGSPAEACQGEAVVARTAALWALAHRPAGADCDLLDDDSVQRTLGVSGEMRAAVEAVDATRGLALIEDGSVIPAAQHQNSGGLTESGFEDAAKPFPLPQTPEDIERFVREAPEGLYTNSGDPASARWIRILDAKILRARAARQRDLGSLRDIRVLERTPTGRVKSLLLIGSRGERTVMGLTEIAGILSPGSLRSAFFSLQPLHDGRKLSRLIVWGAGTGSGFGLSRDGLVARVNAGLSWREALKAYFPGAEIRTTR